MYCPRCGRPIGERANFCGGCGLSRAEILKLNQAEADVPKDTVETDYSVYDRPSSDYDDVNAQTADILTDDVIRNIAEDNKSSSSTEESVPGTLQTDYTIETPSYTTQTDIDPFSEDPVRRMITESSYVNVPNSTSFQESDVKKYLDTHSDYLEDYIETSEEYHTLGTGDYLLMFLIAFIPVLGVIYLVYTAFSSENVNKRSFARALLIMVIFAVIALVVYIFGIAASIVFGGLY